MFQVSDIPFDLIPVQEQLDARAQCNTPPASSHGQPVDQMHSSFRRQIQSLDLSSTGHSCDLRTRARDWTGYMLGGYNCGYTNFTGDMLRDIPLSCLISQLSNIIVDGRNPQKGNDPFFV